MHTVRAGSMRNKAVRFGEATIVSAGGTFVRCWMLG